jgi:hypothetical protein
MQEQYFHEFSHTFVWFLPFRKNCAQISPNVPAVWEPLARQIERFGVEIERSGMT